MEARNANGSWAGPDNGWTEGTFKNIFCFCVTALIPDKGDKWAYSFDVVHDIPTLIEYRGGNVSFVESLEAHFNGGHNDQTNEVSH